MSTAKQFISDEKLINLYLTGSEEALESLIVRHQKKIYSYIYTHVNSRELAEDIFQDTFFKIINTLKRGQYNEEGKFINWSMRIAHNLIIDFYRKDKKLPTVSGAVNEDGEEVDIFNTIKVYDESIEDKVLRKQTQKGLRTLISQLPDEQREVLMMRHSYDMSFKEIAETTNVSINTALGRMRYALLNLKKMLEESNICVEA
ncbi:MAG: sigma-70 family RNA polymerase sigma factor [Bacteroidetes bacterium]|nr:sigma-70 family RNA polymerase sigma factor [Bacteroidota bacterium]